MPLSLSAFPCCPRGLLVLFIDGYKNTPNWSIRTHVLCTVLRYVNCLLIAQASQLVERNTQLTQQIVDSSLYSDWNSMYTIAPFPVCLWGVTTFWGDSYVDRDSAIALFSSPHINLIEGHKAEAAAAVAAFHIKLFHFPSFLFFRNNLWHFIYIP